MNHIINNDELPIIIEALIMAKYTCLDTMMSDIQNIESLKIHIIPLNEYMNLIKRLSENTS